MHLVSPGRCATNGAATTHVRLYSAGRGPGTQPGPGSICLYNVHRPCMKVFRSLGTNAPGIFFPTHIRPKRVLGDGSKSDNRHHKTKSYGHAGPRTKRVFNSIAQVGTSHSINDL